MIRLGTALKSTEFPYHRCVVISDPQGNGGQVVLVRVTTDDGTWPDRDCLVGPADWVELEHQSTLAYSTIKCGPATKALETAIRSGLFTVIASPPNEVLRRIIQAARTAKECHHWQDSGWRMKLNAPNCLLRSATPLRLNWRRAEEKAKRPPTRYK